MKSLTDLEFNIIDTDLTIYQEIRWLLHPYGDRCCEVLNLKCHILQSDNSSFNVLVKNEYIKGLACGLYSQRIVLIDIDNKVTNIDNLDVLYIGREESGDRILAMIYSSELEPYLKRDKEDKEKYKETENTGYDRAYPD